MCYIRMFRTFIYVNMIYILFYWTHTCTCLLGVVDRDFWILDCVGTLECHVESVHPSVFDKLGGLDSFGRAAREICVACAIHAVLTVCIYLSLCSAFHPPSPPFPIAVTPSILLQQLNNNNNITTTNFQRVHES